MLFQHVARHLAKIALSADADIIRFSLSTVNGQILLIPRTATSMLPHQRQELPVEGLTLSNDDSDLI
jgi:hypothetical protein